MKQLKKDLKLFIEGFIIGIGKIIPGVSGAMFAMMFGVYEKAVAIISDLRKLKGNFRFMLILFVSVLLAILLGSKGIKSLLDNYYLCTMMFFIGMMAAGIKPLFKHLHNKKIEYKNVICALLVVAVLVALSLLDISSKVSVIEKTPLTVIILFLCGMLDAMGTVIPGVCGTALLMIAGYYDQVITSLSNLLTLTDLGNTLVVLAPFTLGLIIGIFLISKLVNYLFHKHKVTTYCSIIGFAISSTFILLFQAFSKPFVLVELLISVLLFIIGFFIVHTLENNWAKKNPIMNFISMT